MMDTAVVVGSMFAAVLAICDVWWVRSQRAAMRGYIAHLLDQLQTARAEQARLLNKLAGGEDER